MIKNQFDQKGCIYHYFEVDAGKKQEFWIEVIQSYQEGADRGKHFDDLENVDGLSMNELKCWKDADQKSRNVYLQVQLEDDDQGEGQLKDVD